MSETPISRPDHHTERSSSPRARASAARRRWQLRVTAAALFACAGLAVVGVSGTLFAGHGGVLHTVLLLGGTVIFMIGGVATTRMLSGAVERNLAMHGMRSSGVAVRLGLTVFGYVMLTLTALSLLSVPLQQLVLGGALTGVVVGIAAQQTLSNVFAGLVILMARPFRVGSEILVRSGALNGPFTGRVTSLGLTYTTLLTQEGILLLPNSALLASGITVELTASAEPDREAA